MILQYNQAFKRTEQIFIPLTHKWSSDTEDDPNADVPSGESDVDVNELGPERTIVQKPVPTQMGNVWAITRGNNLQLAKQKNSSIGEMETPRGAKTERIEKVY